MTVQEWQAVLGVILGVSAVAGILFTILRFYIKAFARQELDDIRHELKPNGGSSIKDQVTRLEENQKMIQMQQAAHIAEQKEDDRKFEHRMEKMEEKIDRIFEIIIEKLGH